MQTAAIEQNDKRTKGLIYTTKEVDEKEGNISYKSIHTEIFNESVTSDTSINQSNREIIQTDEDLDSENGLYTYTFYIIVKSLRSL